MMKNKNYIVNKFWDGIESDFDRYTKFMTEEQTKKIGTRISFKRFGNFPTPDDFGTARSTNYRDQKLENGVSVFFSDDTVNTSSLVWFSGRTKIIEGTAICTGFGSDNEPLIDIDTIK